MFSRLNTIFRSVRERRLIKDEQGIAAVEFALILPILILLMLGTVDLTRAMMADRKLSIMSSSIGDLVAREDEMTNATMSAIFSAIDPLVAPYNEASAAVRVSSLEITGPANNRKAQVLWSRGQNKTPLGNGATVDVPNNIMTNTDGLVMVEATFDYNPLFTVALTGPVTFEDQFFFVPRISSTIEFD